MKLSYILLLVALIGSVFGNSVPVVDAATSETAPTQTELKRVAIKEHRNALVTMEWVSPGRIQQGMIRDNKDLMRYSIDTSLNDSDCHQKGLAIRGVEGSRVGVSINGVSLPDPEENSLYTRHGNLNSSYLSIDPRLVRNIDVVKGVSSFNIGNGALGGGVNYQTLQGRDLPLSERQFSVTIKNGYSSCNRKWTNTVGFGTGNGSVDATLLYSQRRGCETENINNRDYAVKGKGSDVNIRDSARGAPDPSKHGYHSFSVKIGYQINENHRTDASLNG